MTAELDVHADISKVKEKCTLDMSTYEDLPACNAPSHHYVTDIPKDDTDGSYVFVSSTDAAAIDDHVVKDLSGQAKRPPNADMDITVVVQNGESSIRDASKTGSCLVDAHNSYALEDSHFKISGQVKESDSLRDEIRVPDALQSYHTEVNEIDHGLDSSQKAEDPQSVAAVDQFSITEVNRSEGFDVESPQKVEGIQILEEDRTIAIPASSDTKANHVGERGVESLQKADHIQNDGENEPVAIKSSDAETNSGMEIEEESSQNTDDFQIHEENGIVASTKSSDTEANPMEEPEAVSPRKLEDMEFQGQKDVEASIESFATMTKCEEETDVNSSQKVSDIQISEVDGIMAINKSSDTLDNHGEETEVESSGRVENIQDSQDTNLEAADCNCVCGRVKIDEVENKSQLSNSVEVGESQITGMSSTTSEPDRPDDSVEKIKGECISGLALNAENSERTQITTSKDAENNWVVVEEQANPSIDVPLIEPSVGNSEDMEQNLTAAPCPPVSLKLETENPDGSISISNADGLRTSMNEDGPLETFDHEDTLANRMSLHENTKISTVSENCEIAIVETRDLSPTKLASDPEVEVNKINMDEQEVNFVLELEESSEASSHPIVDECVKVEVLEGSLYENGDGMPNSPEEPKFSNADNSVAGSQLIPEGSEPLESIETQLSAATIGNTPVDISETLSTLSLNDPVLKPEVEDDTKSENVTSAVDDVQPDQVVSETNDICILGNSDLESKFENGHTAKDDQFTFPSNDVGSECSLCIPIGCEEKESSVSEVPNANGVNKSCESLANSMVNTDSESHYNESSSILCSAANEKTGDDVEIASTIGSRDMPGDNIVSDVVIEIDGNQTNGENDATHVSRQDEPSFISPQTSTNDASEGQNIGAEPGTRSFYFLIRVPRFEDDNIRERIKYAQSEVERKTQDRDAIRVQMHTMRATWKVFDDNLEAAVSEERAARNSLKLKRQEMDSVQSQITKVKNAMSVDDIDGRIRNIEHTIEHETLPLKEEKQLIREIKQLKQLREQLALAMGKEDELQQVLDQKDQIEERLKLLRKEVDLLRDNVLKAETATRAAKKKRNDENVKLEELQSQFKAADKIRQEAYANLQSMKKQAYEKNKYFWKYRDDVKEAYDLASKGDRERLQHLCVNQVETVMELWNKNDEFRKDYMKCNMRSTLRRLRTLDGRSLGPDEEPPLLPNIVKERSTRDNSLPSTQETEKRVPAEITKEIKIVEIKNRSTKNKKADKVTSVDSHTRISEENEVERVREEEIDERTKEEKEQAAKAEELRKEEEAAKLKEQRMLEEKTKAKEALERKKRNAERAQARAVMKTQKEAEEKEKRKEKRAKKKERKMAAATEGGNGIDEKLESAENDITETPAKVPKMGEGAGKEVNKSRQYRKQQSKAKSIPPPLRNRGKRRMQAWMWVLLIALVLALVFVGQQRLIA